VLGGTNLNRPLFSAGKGCLFSPAFQRNPAIGRGKNGTRAILGGGGKKRQKERKQPQVRFCSEKGRYRRSLPAIGGGGPVLNIKGVRRERLLELRRENWCQTKGGCFVVKKETRAFVEEKMYCSLAN